MKRSPIDKMLDGLVWKRKHPYVWIQSTPFLIYGTVLKIEDYRIRVYELSNGKRVFDAEDMEKFVGLTKIK